MDVHAVRLRPSTATLLACLLCLQACTASQQSRRIVDTSPEDLPPAVELTQTPFLPQTEHQCGPAALATVLQSHRVSATPQELTPFLYIPERKGSLQIEMAATARRYGMLPYPLEPGLEHLLVEIAAGHPVLVMQNLGLSWIPRWHYAVVVGYDLDSRQLVLRSGTTERWLTTFSTFEKTWQRADSWALVIVPAGEMPATAGISTYLESAYAFEQTGLHDHAIDAYQAATRRWPAAATGWLALGNLAYLSGDSNEAVRALHTASRLSPGEIVAWNNLAYALHKSGCPAQALASLQCAIRLSPDDPNIRDSEQELRNMALRRAAEHCPEITCE